jgi:hypothetical protein
MTAIKKGNWYFEADGQTYAFSLEKGIEKATLIFDKDAADPVYVGYDKNWENGAYTEVTVIETTGTAAEDAQKLELSKGVFPHVFGTDSQGRDLMARCMYGARVSIIIGMVAAMIVLVIGSMYGSIAGFCGGKVDFTMMRLVDLIYSVPDVLIVLLLQVVLKEPLQVWFDTSTFPLVVALSKLGVHLPHLFPIDRRGGTVVVPGTEVLPLTVGQYTQYLGILFGHPSGAGTGGRSQDHLAAVAAHLINDLVQEGKIIFALSGFQCGPGENADGHFVAVCQLHQTHIFVPDGFVMNPLLGIVVGAMEKMGKGRAGVDLMGHKRYLQKLCFFLQYGITTGAANQLKS